MQEEPRCAFHFDIASPGADGGRTTTTGASSICKTWDCFVARITLKTKNRFVNNEAACVHWSHRGVAQLGSALRSGRRGRRFESSLPDYTAKATVHHLYGGFFFCIHEAVAKLETDSP